MSVVILGRTERERVYVCLLYLSLADNKLGKKVTKSILSEFQTMGKSIIGLSRYIPACDDAEESESVNWGKYLGSHG